MPPRVLPEQADDFRRRFDAALGWGQITKKVIAPKLNIQPRELNNWLRFDPAPPDPEALVRIVAKECGVRPEFLRGLDTVIAASADAGQSEFGLTADAMAALSLLGEAAQAIRRIQPSQP